MLDYHKQPHTNGEQPYLNEGVYIIHQGLGSFHDELVNTSNGMGPNEGNKEPK